MAPPSGSVCATRLVDRDWGSELLVARDRHRDSLLIVCPFIKAEPILELLGDVRPTALKVITRFNLADFGRGVSDIRALRTVLGANGRARGVRGLHAKVFLFGDTCAAVTSANLTSRGLRTNEEFGCISDDGAFVSACHAYFDRLWHSAGADVLAEQLDEWDEEVNAFLGAGGRPERELHLPDYGASVGFDTVVGPPAGWPAESRRAFVKFFGRSGDRRPWGFSTLDEVERAGCHWACTYPRGKRPRQVGDGDSIFMARLVKHPNDMLVFGRGIGMAHVDGADDATLEEVVARPWKDRWPHYIRVHDAEFVAGSLANGVPLSELMNALGSEAYASTHRNRIQGERNLDPRRALRQQAAVELTDHAALWLNERLDLAFEIHGRLPAQQLAALDWPA